MADKTTKISATAKATADRPKGWKMTTLREVAEKVEYGYTESANDEKIGPKFLRITDIQNDFIDWETVPYCLISNKDYEKYKLYVGDVVIARTGNSTGTTATIKDDVEAVFASYLIRFKLDKEKTDYKFIDFLLRSNFWKKFVVSVKGGSAQGGANAKDFSIFPINLPPLPEQRAIAAVLSSFDDKIELLREQNKTLEATAQAIFKEWFINFNFPDKDGKPYKTNNGKMINSELGDIPEGWRVGRLAEDKISKFVKININHFNGTKDYVETSNVNLSDFVGNFEKITFSDRPSRANMQPVVNSFWFARMAESRKHLLFQDRDSYDIKSKILSTGFAGIQCVKEYLYFYWCFILSDIFNNLKNQYAEGAVQVAISNSGIQQIQLPIPPTEVARKFTETVRFYFEKISNNNAQIQILSALRDTLLPKLMSGEVRVKGFEN